MKIGPLRLGALDALLAAVPVAVILEIAHAPATWIFVASAVAIIPLAGWMGRATEHLALHFGAGVGGLLNATFGNAAELIIALLALREGFFALVKASVAGSIIGNILLVLGASMLAGGLRHPRQTFNQTAASLGSTLLALSAIGLVIPAIFHFLAKAADETGEDRLSLAIAVVLFATYLLSLVFSLRTHRHLFAGEQHPAGPDARWGRGKAIAVLVGATVLVAVMGELLVGSAVPTAEAWGMTEVFVGVILVAIIGNAAEHSSAVLMAVKGHMDLSIQIAVGSGIQIALFVAPILVFASYAIGPGPMDLIFTPLEVIAVVLSVFVVKSVARDGESHWMEGVMLLAVYVILAIAFFHLPA